MIVVKLGVSLSVAYPKLDSALNVQTTNEPLERRRFAMLMELEKFTREHVRCSIRNYHDREDVIQECHIMGLTLENRYSLTEKEEFIKIARTAIRNRVRDFIRAQIARNRNLVFDVEIVESHPSRRDYVIACTILDHIQSRCSDKAARVISELRKGSTPAECQSTLGIPKSSYYMYMDEIKFTARQGG